MRFISVSFVCFSVAFGSMLSLAACSDDASSTPMPTPDAGQDGGVTDAADASDAATVVDSSGYDHACTADSQCVAVFGGNICAVCSCPNDAINRSALAGFNAAVSAALNACGPRPAIACAACEDKPVACVAGRCAIVTATDAGPDAADAAPDSSMSDAADGDAADGG